MEFLCSRINGRFFHTEADLDEGEASAYFNINVYRDLRLGGVFTAELEMEADDRCQSLELRIGLPDGMTLVDSPVLDGLGGAGGATQ